MNCNRQQVKRFHIAALIALFILAGGAAVSASAQTFSVVGILPSTIGPITNPAAQQVVQGRNGEIYTISTNQGGLLSATTSGTFAEVAQPFGNGVTLGTDGNFYTAQYFDRIGCGEVWKTTPLGTATELNTICGTDGNGPTVAPIQAPNGLFYGPSSEIPSGGPGTIYSITSSGSVGLVHTFVAADGNNPVAPLVVGSDGNLYGGTRSGGTNNDGVLFKVTPGGTYTVLHNFAGSDGADLEHGLFLASDGNLYGLTQVGGTDNNGVFFKLTNSGTYTVLYNLPITYSPANSSLVQATDGNLYGLLGQGNSSEPGWIYSLTTGGTFTILHEFCQETNCADGVAPSTPLMQHTNGNLYGFTVHGGDTSVCQGDGCGVFYSFDIGAGAFASLESTSGKVGSKVGIFGQGFSHSSVVKFNGVQATTVTLSGTTYLTAIVPTGATDGKVTVITGSTTLTSTAKYTVHNSWASVAAMPTGTAQSSAAVLGGDIYVIGGANASGTVLDNVQIYNPTTNTWSSGTALPTVTQHSSAAVVNNILYVFGGDNGVTAPTNAVWAYSPTTKAWTSMAPMLTARNGTLAVVEKNIVYVMGGNLGNGANFVATVESYNPATNTWTEETPMDGAKDYPAGGLIGATIVSADGAVASGQITGDTEGYNATTNAWSDLTADPTARTGSCSGVISSALYDVGGYINNDGAATTVNESYSLSTNKWTTTLLPIPQGTMYAASAVDNGQLYCFGGLATLSGSAIGNVQIYQP